MSRAIRTICIMLLCLPQLAFGQHALSEQDKIYYNRQLYYLDNLADPALPAFLDTLDNIAKKEGDRYMAYLSENLRFFVSLYIDNSQKDALYHSENLKALAKELGMMEEYYIASTNEIAVVMLEGNMMEANRQVLALLDEAKSRGEKVGIYHATLSLYNLYESRGDHYASYNAAKDLLGYLKKDRVKDLSLLSSTYQALAGSAISIKRYRECVSYADSMIMIAPDSREIYYTKAVASYRLGNFGEFRKDLEKGESLGKQGIPVLQKDYVYLPKAFALILDKDYDGATAYRDSFESLVLREDLDEELATSQGDYRKAYSMLKDFHIYADSLQNNTYNNDVTESLAQLKASELSREITAQKSERTRMRYIYIITLLAVIIIASVLLVLFRVKASMNLKKTNRQLTAANEKANKAISQLELANGYKRNFVMSLSTELRQSLMTIQGYSQLLTDNYGEQNEDDVWKIGEMLNESYQNMDKFLKDLTETIKLDNIEDEPLIAKYVGNDLARQAIKEEWAKPWEECPVDFSTALGDDIIVNTDYYRAKLIIRRMIHFICKSGNENRIAVCCDLDETRNFVIYSVSENSKPFPKDLMDKIFDRYIEFDGKHIEGLYILKRLAETINVRIWFDKEYAGTGAKAYISIPLQGKAA